MKQAMALIGNLISNGAGSNELRDTAIAGGLRGIAGKIPGVGALGGIGGAMKQELTGKAAQSLLPSWAQRSYGNGGKGGGAKGGDGEKDSDSKNSNSPTASKDNNTAKKAISGGGNKEDKNKKDQNKNNSDNTNNKKPETKGQGNSLVNEAINNAGKEAGGYDDLYEK